MHEATKPSNTTPQELHLLPGIISIGRAGDNHIQIDDDPAVSPYHAKVVTYFQESFVIDIGSQQGVYLNGRRVYKHSLKVGDTLQVGQQRFVIKPASPWFMIEPRTGDKASDPADLKTVRASR